MNTPTFIKRALLRHNIRWRRLTLFTPDGPFFERWGIQKREWGGVLVHRITGPDPDRDLHDHPFTFVSFVVKGYYVEERNFLPWAVQAANLAEAFGQPEHLVGVRGDINVRSRWSIRRMNPDECHRIISVPSSPCWTVVIHGPWRRLWGFYMANGFVTEHEYNHRFRVDTVKEWTNGDWARRAV